MVTNQSCDESSNSLVQWSGNHGTAFSVDEGSVKETVVSYFLLVSAVLTFRPCPWLREGFFVPIELQEVASQSGRPILTI